MKGPGWRVGDSPPSPAAVQTRPGACFLGSERKRRVNQRPVVRAQPSPKLPTRHITIRFPVGWNLAGSLSPTVSMACRFTTRKMIPGGWGKCPRRSHLSILGDVMEQKTCSWESKRNQFSTLKLPLKQGTQPLTPKPLRSHAAGDQGTDP